MEFSLFAHMERLDPQTPHQALYREFIELCQLADQGGMRAIWTGEHHAMEFTIAPNPFLSIVDLGPSHKKRQTGYRHGCGPLLAPDQTGGRSCGY